MAETVRVVVDAMGGDNAPAEPVKAAVEAVAEREDIDVILTGRQDVIEKELSKFQNYPKERIQIVNTTEVIETAEPPVLAIRKKKDSSIVVGLNLVKKQEAEAFVSSGSSGAILVGGQVIVGRSKGVQRPPLAPLIPTQNGVSLLIDCGANVDARPDIAERYKTEFTYPIHNHSEFELNFTEKAAGVRRIVGDSSEVIGDYDLVLITGKDLEHVWEQNECRSKEIREITIQFSSDLFFKSFINKNQFDSIRRMLDKAQKGLCFPMSAILKIYPLLDTLASEKQGFYAVIKFMTILYELSLFEEEARTLSSSSFAKIDIHSDSRRVQKVQEYINTHYQEEIRLGQLADMVGMTDVSFSRFFKLRTGKNLSDYIIDIRLGFASRLLVDSTMSIAEICYECGFNNLSNFNRIFKKKKSCSPKEFRENYRKKKKLI